MDIYNHEPGQPVKCLSIPVILHKAIKNVNGQSVLSCGFKVGGGIDQDPNLAPFKYPDKGIYITAIEEGGPAYVCGLQIHDKILQVNGYDFTIVTHKKAVDYIKKFDTLKILILRQ